MFIYGEHCKKDYNKKKSFNVNVIFRACYLMLSLPLLVAVAANETPQQVVTKYNNYKAICNGLGYKNLGCKGSEMHFSIWYLDLLIHICTVVYNRIIHDLCNYVEMSLKNRFPNNKDLMCHCKIYCGTYLIMLSSIMIIFENESTAKRNICCNSPFNTFSIS